MLGLTLAAALCGSCAVTPLGILASAGASAGTNYAMNTWFSGNKLKGDAKAAYERAPPCTSMSHGVQNGRAVTLVRDTAWFNFYEAANGRRLTPSPGQGLVMVDYEITNRSNTDIIVTPRRLTVTNAQGQLFNEKAGVGGIQTDETTPDEGAILPDGQAWTMVSVFDVPPGEYALMVPNGRTETDPEPTWVDGCRIPPPNVASG
ncbi:MAG: hypothetical protein HYZ40_16200 [Rhodospirillales bacterium]|nr:hypothetical protein [Rhodospirillales bacterium]